MPPPVVMPPVAPIVPATLNVDVGLVALMPTLPSELTNIPAVGLPEESTWVANLNPPPARALNSFWLLDLNRLLVESAHTNAPWWFAWARVPAAKLLAPFAVF